MDPDTPRHHLCLSPESPHREATGRGPIPSRAATDARAVLAWEIHRIARARRVEPYGVAGGPCQSPPTSRHTAAQASRRRRSPGYGESERWDSQVDGSGPSHRCLNDPGRGQGRFRAARENRVPPVYGLQFKTRTGRCRGRCRDKATAGRRRRCRVSCADGRELRDHRECPSRKPRRHRSRPR